MGFCFSCCRRQELEEFEPLLSSQSDSLPPPTSHVQKAVDVLAALKAKKFPSQDQLNAFLQVLLRSEVLNIHGISGYGPVSDDACKVILDVRECIAALLLIGMEKNDDDKLQHLLYQTSKIDAAPVYLDAEASLDREFLDHVKDAVDLPSPTEFSSDITKLAQSTRTLFTLLLTSSAFRAILSSLFAITREVLASTASSVASVAAHIEAGATEVERAARLDDISFEGVQGRVAEAFGRAKEAGSDIDGVSVEGADRLRDQVIGRIQETISRAQKNPQYRSALLTILVILRKYTDKISLAASIVPPAPSIDSPPITLKPTIEIDAHLTQALADLKTLLERAASGMSLDPPLEALVSVIVDISKAPAETGMDLRAFFTDLGKWFDTALSRPEYITSRDSTDSAEELYTRARAFLANSSSPLAQDLRNLSSLADSFISALSHDHALTRFVSSLDALSVHIPKLGQDTLIRTQRKWRSELIRDLIGWVLPKVLRVLRSVPMPRIEYMDPAVDVAVDSLLTSTGTNLVPDQLTIQNWNEIKIGMVDGVTTNTSTRVRIHADGLRISAREVGYYARYKGLIPYSDEGLLSVFIGQHSTAGQGLSLDIELETASDTWQNVESNTPLFQVTSIHAAISGFILSLDKSKHWILNKLFLQPLVSGPIIRRLLSRILETQVKSGTEQLEVILRGILRDAKKKAGNSEEGPGWGDYWEAILDGVPSTQNNAESDEELPLVESHTTATLKGIVHTTSTQPNPSSSSPPTPSTTVLAIGGGAQLFPGRGGAYNEPTAPSTVEVAKTTMDEMEEDVEAVLGTTMNVVANNADHAIKIREDVEETDGRFEARKMIERGRSGWRSRAFDI